MATQSSAQPATAAAVCVCDPARVPRQQQYYTGL